MQALTSQVEPGDERAWTPFVNNCKTRPRLMSLRSALSNANSSPPMLPTCLNSPSRPCSDRAMSMRSMSTSKPTVQTDKQDAWHPRHIMGKCVPRLGGLANTRNFKPSGTTIPPMAMTPFYTRFHDLAFAETRTAVVPSHPTLPRGPWGFLEFYCDEPDCDCRRVLFQVVLDENDDTRVWASINYGWETHSFYRRWSRDPLTARQITGASLDPLNPQSEHSHALLELFQVVLLRDAEYIERIKRHYRMFKGLPNSHGSVKGSSPRKSENGGA